MDKAFILSEIKRTAAENGGKPLGRDAFRKETGIKDYDWGLYWNRFSEAQREAGLSPNMFNIAYNPEELITAFIALIRKLGHFPLQTEVLRESRLNPLFPNETTFRNQLGLKSQTALRILEYCQENTGFEDIIKICEPLSAQENESVKKKEEGKNVKPGYVYLFKAGRRFKIGKSYDLNRRHGELAPQSPEEIKRIHTIKTDDPSGVEAYWHRRFEARRTRGEWFELSGDDVKAFKRWRSIY